jgi:hypothetical protein
MDPRLTVLGGSLWRRKGRLHRILGPVAPDKTKAGGRLKNKNRLMVFYEDVRGGPAQCREVEQFIARFKPA